MDIAGFALAYATEKHEGQLRKSGEEFIVHPIRVGKLVQDYKASRNIKRLVAVAYLHDVLENTKATYYDLVENFGFEIASMVLEVTTNKDMKDAVGDKSKYLSYKLKHMTNWALVVKLCDRLDNISDMKGFTQEKRKKYIEETAFIKDFLKENRKLSVTHKEIISAIEAVLENESYTDSKLNRL